MIETWAALEGAARSFVHVAERQMPPSAKRMYAGSTPAVDSRLHGGYRSMAGREIVILPIPVQLRVLAPILPASFSGRIIPL